jgi:hypothetical protein
VRCLVRRWQADCPKCAFMHVPALTFALLVRSSVTASASALPGVIVFAVGVACLAC